MTMPVASMLEKWHDFYLLVGTAAATLVALLFVAASIGAGILTVRRAATTRTYMSPVVVHFASVFFAAATALIPSHTRASLGALIGLNAVAGAVFAAVTLRSVVRHHAADWPDRLGYGAVPLVGYLAMLAAAGLMLVGSEAGLDLLAGALVLLL